MHTLYHAQLLSRHQPNHSSTYPQPNVGFDTIIAVNTTQPPTPGNSTSIKNKGPSGLKFCMRRYLTKLTTAQHNFNPTIFWVGVGGGGSCRFNRTQIFFG